VRTRSSIEIEDRRKMIDFTGAQGRDRTTDTAIFSHVHLYFLDPRTV
jgi:hypothetical protein